MFAMFAHERMLFFWCASAPLRTANIANIGILSSPVKKLASKPTNTDGGCAIRERFLSDSAPYSQSRERKAKMKIKTAKQFRNGVDSAFETQRAGPRSAAFGGLTSGPPRSDVGASGV